MLLGLALWLPHLAQLWLVRAWSWFPGGGHQATDRNPAYSPADDLCWLTLVLQPQHRCDGEAPVPWQLCCGLRDECPITEHA